jgi:hypothetical protein
MIWCIYDYLIHGLESLLLLLL